MTERIMTEDQLEALLFEEEGPALDFKRDQYPFEGASKEKKAELLKDILAFGNAWRRSSAYILIGVQEVRGGRSDPVGLSTQLDDAKIQQFVNGKTNQPVEFSYRAVEFEGVELGVIAIPVQARPVYLKANYGRLQKNVVYIRRGSSTDVADPDEVARMGRDATVGTGAQPRISFQLADVEERSKLGTSISLASLHFDPTIDPAALQPDPPKTRNPFKQLASRENPRFYDELLDYITKKLLLKPIGFVVANESGVTAWDVQVRIEISAQEGLHVLDEAEIPELPSRDLLGSLHIPGGVVVGSAAPRPSVERFRDHFEVAIDFGKVLPQSTIWSEGRFFIGAERSQKVSAVSRIFAENLPSPLEVRVEVSIDTETRPMDAEAILELADQF